MGSKNFWSSELEQNFSGSTMERDPHDISHVYKYLTNNGFKSVIKEKHDKDIKTWPAINPKSCIDYIWIKGEDVKICSANIFGNALNTDHKGVKCCLDIK